MKKETPRLTDALNSGAITLQHGWYCGFHQRLGHFCFGALGEEYSVERYLREHPGAVRPARLPRLRLPVSD